MSSLIVRQTAAARRILAKARPNAVSSKSGHSVSTKTSSARPPATAEFDSRISPEVRISKSRAGNRTSATARRWLLVDPGSVDKAFDRLLGQIARAAAISPREP